MSILLLFFIGTAFGSFLGVIIDRLPRNVSFLASRSKCDSCGRTLGIVDLIPIVSFLIFKGRCRRCKARIPVRLLFLEILSGTILVLLYSLLTIQALNLPFFIFSIFVVYSLIAIFFIDIDHGIIPDSLLILLSIVTFAYLSVFNRGAFIEHTVSGLVAFLGFLLLFLATRGRGIGFGDVKFAFVIGLVTGYPGVFVAFYVSFVVGAVVSLFLILTGKKKIRHDTIPFGPFLAIGTCVALFWSDYLIKLLWSMAITWPAWMKFPFL